jgi:hypothetical protein
LLIGAASPHFRRITGFDTENGLAVAEDQAATQFTVTQVPDVVGYNLATMTRSRPYGPMKLAQVLSICVREVGLLMRS